MVVRGTKHEMVGGTDLKWGGRAPLSPPLATATVLGSLREEKAFLLAKVQKTFQMKD